MISGKLYWRAQIFFLQFSHPIFKHINPCATFQDQGEKKTNSSLSRPSLRKDSILQLVQFYYIFSRGNISKSYNCSQLQSYTILSCDHLLIAIVSNRALLCLKIKREWKRDSISNKKKKPITYLNIFC